jgi:hypothetical protein
MNGEWCESFESPEAQFLSVFRSLASHVCAPILDLYAQEPFDQPDIPWLVEQVFRKTIMLKYAKLIPSLDICRRLPPRFNMEP